VAAAAGVAWFLDHFTISKTAAAAAGPRFEGDGYSS
jgi:hypothetical protein